MNVVRVVVGGSLLGACLMAGVASAVEVNLSTAWMRPVAAGAPSAMAYVDMQSDAAVELIGASAPVAQSVAIVVGNEGGKGAERIVPSLALPANKMVRLAYLGDHLRLVAIQKAVSNGDVVPLTLRFKTASGEVVERQIDIQVRGLTSPPLNNGKGVGMPAPADVRRSAPACAATDEVDQASTGTRSASNSAIS